MRPFLACTLVVFLALAGCSGKRPVPEDSVTGVSIEAPPVAAPGDRVVVCWRVEGRGTAPHVALHWSNTSQATKPGRSFTDYADGAAYPDNASSLRPQGYAVTARFCTLVTAPQNGTLFLVGHAIGKEGGVGVLSGEVALKPLTGRVHAVETPTGPSSSPPRGDVRLCWIVRGTGNVGHVDLHWARESQAANPDRSVDDYSEGQAYPNNTASPEAHGYDLHPDGTEFCADVRMPASGLVFVVAHVIDRLGGTGFLSGEKSVGVE